MDNESEYMCCVVRIVDVNPHPNADRLDLVRFTAGGEGTFPYEIVTGRGEFEPGDSAVYISPDAVVPLDGPFAFLRSRLDAAGKERYRIRSARLRGIFSPGLLIPWEAPCGDVGKDVSERLGVAKWEAVASGIDADALTVAPESRKTKLLPAIDPFPVYTVTALKKCPRLFAEGEPVVITEKIHGCNFRFGYGDTGKFYYGTHRTPLVDVRSWWKRLTDWCSGKRRRINKSPGFGDPWSEAVKLFELEDVARVWPQLIFYGELFGVTGTGENVQDLTYGRKQLDMRVFDVWHGAERRWLTIEEREHVLGRVMAGVFGVQEVPRLYEGPYSFELVKKLAEQNSTFGGIREGVVVESRAQSWETRRKAKWVSERYHMRKD